MLKIYQTIFFSILQCGEFIFMEKYISSSQESSSSASIAGKDYMNEDYPDYSQWAKIPISKPRQPIQGCSDPH